MVGEEDLPHVGRGTARPPPPRRPDGRRAPAGTSVGFGSSVWMASILGTGRCGLSEGRPPPGSVAGLGRIHPGLRPARDLVPEERSALVVLLPYGPHHLPLERGFRIDGLLDGPSFQAHGALGPARALPRGARARSRVGREPLEE